MLTPSFELSQNDTYLIIVIKARYAKVTEAEIFIDGNNFKFYSKPYFLRLTLPGSLIEDGRETAKYDVDKGFFTITIPKETPGEHFDGLDMLTTLLAPPGIDSAKESVVEIIGEPVEDEAGIHQEEGVYEEEDEDIDWQVPQQPFKADELTMGGATYYGFANRRTGVFARLQDELCGIVDVPDPDHMTLSSRREARQLAELQKFDEDHYLADFMEDDSIQSVLKFKTPWDSNSRKLKKATAGKEDDSTPEMGSNICLTDEEREQMIKLPKKQYLLDQSTEASVMLGLVDIMYAYCYDVRTTEGDHSVESSWTMCKLSATLSWLDCFSSVDDVLMACFTRTLCYPLYRHWKLNLEVLKDVISIFYLGRTQLLKCLLDTHRLLSQDEPRYILNDLYITDYCVWIQSLSHEKIRSLAQALDSKVIDKSKMTLKLEDMERRALSTLNDGGEEEDEDDSTDSDDDSDDEEETDDSEDDSEADTNSDDIDGHEQVKPIYQYGYPNILQKSEIKNKDSDVAKVPNHEHELLPTAKYSPRTCGNSSPNGQQQECIGSYPVNELQKSDTSVSAIEEISAAVRTISLNSSEEQTDSNERLANQEDAAAETELKSSETCHRLTEQNALENTKLSGDESNKSQDQQIDLDKQTSLSDVNAKDTMNDLTEGRTPFDTWAKSPPSKKVEMF